MASAWLLAPHHEVTLFEKAAELGGHAHTAVVDFGTAAIPVDTAFVVLNSENYTNLVAFFKVLNIKTVQTPMSISVSLKEGGFEWSNELPFGLFADLGNLFRPSFWRFLGEIGRFNKTALSSLKAGISADMTFGQFLEENHFSRDFCSKYVFPITGAIWSTGSSGVSSSPAHSVLSFLDNHGIFSPGKKMPFTWRTVRNGSREYIKAAEKDMRLHGAHIRLNADIKTIKRPSGEVVIETAVGEERFERVIIATHADTALSLLKDPTPHERELLSKFLYEKNEVFLHGDRSLMPRSKRAWAAWNYLGETDGNDGKKKASLTYHMNRLQHIDPAYPLFVTLNPRHTPESSLIYGKYFYDHPIYTPAAIKAQSQLESLQNQNGTLYCGSYFGHGFHEDGIASAISAVRHLGITPPWSGGRQG